MRKTAKLAVVFVFATAIAGAIFSIFPWDAQLASADANDDMLAARVGTDDGYALVLDYSGDLQGSLETCG